MILGLILSGTLAVIYVVTYFWTRVKCTHCGSYRTFKYCEIIAGGVEIDPAGLWWCCRKCLRTFVIEQDRSHELEGPK